MKIVNRPFKTIKLKHPLVLDSGDGTHEISEFKLYKPLAGQLKKINMARMEAEDVLKLASLCSELSEAELDLLDYEDLLKLDTEMAGFFSLGSKGSETKTPSSTPDNSKQIS